MRYISLYFKFFKNCLMRDMEYNVGFITAVVSALLWVVIQVLFIQIIFGNIKLLGEWSYYEMLAISGFYILINGLLFAFFVRNFNQFNNYVNKGHLDTILVKPVNSQFFVSLRYFNMTHLFHFPVALLIIGYAFSHLTLNITLSKVIIFILVIAASIIICYSLWFMLMCLIFYIEKDEDLREIFINFFSFSKLPDIYSYYLKITLMVLMPAVFAAYVPAAVLLGKVESWFVAYFLGIAVVLFYLSTRLWKLCLKKYTSASN